MIFYVHIGKTGGTTIKRAIRRHFDVQKTKEPQVIEDRIVLLNHMSLADAIDRFGAPSKIAFAYRDPAARFVSGFYCRQRMGYPEHRAVWSAAEAAAFAHFNNANDLAEALGGDDLARRAAAHFAMDAIRHVRRGYQYHFGNMVDFFLDHAADVAGCIETGNIAKGGPAFLRKLGIEADEGALAKTDAATPSYSKALSPLAEANLRDVWAAEYDYYDAFKLLEAELS